MYSFLGIAMIMVSRHSHKTLIKTMSIFPSLCWNLLWLDSAGVVRAITGSVSSHVHQSWCIWKRLFPWCPLPSLTLTILLASLTQESLSFEGRGLIKTSHPGLSAPSLSLSAHCPLVGLCVNFYLLREASLMRAERCTDLSPSLVWQLYWLKTNLKLNKMKAHMCW